jgi:hypothetical protein
LDDVDCTGEEVSILECPSKGWKISNCGRVREIAGVICYETDTFTTSPLGMIDIHVV